MTRQIFVTYCTDSSAAQQQAAQQYLNAINANEHTMDPSHTEVMSNKKSNQWPALQSAIAACKTNNAKLIIAELGTLTSNEHFVKILTNSGIEFYCCDQPFATRNIIEALYQHAKVKKQLHSKKIRAGLEKAWEIGNRSGNPNAARELHKVNKPKVNTAIVFALLLKPIIMDYQTKGFSQRRMVQALNNEGFTAPEGGKWVLSQLQKVLDRMRLNDIAHSSKQLIQELQQQKQSTEQIAAELNNKTITAIKRSGWNAAQVNKLIERIKQIDDIIADNRFTLELLPMIQQYRSHDDASEVLNFANAEQLELTAKQLSAYRKVIEPHIGQVEHVMSQPTHSYTNIENLNFGTAVSQIRNILAVMQNNDINSLSELHLMARDNSKQQAVHTYSENII